MAAKVYMQHYVNGSSKLRRRVVKQGRKASGLAKPQIVRLFDGDKTKLHKRAELMGEYWNENEFIRQAVHKAIENTRSVYIELLNT